VATEQPTDRHTYFWRRSRSSQTTTVA
jgi:hypothetical protein